MLNLNIHELLMGVSRLLDSTMFVPENEDASSTMSRLKRRDVQIRTQQVANEWSTQERAARLRAGIASRARLLDSISQT